MQYAFVGDPAANLSACSVQYPGPNGTSVGNADAMVSVIVHELEEAATDPQLNAWYDRRGYENADKCAWTFGPTSIDSADAKFNLTLGGTNYLIQQNWVNALGGYCGLSY